MKLVIGNKNYSSWSLRAWLHLTESQIAFEEVKVPLFTDGWQQRVAQFSPSGRVPVLIDHQLRVWDSLAIIEHLLERHPAAIGWPADPAARSLARSVSCEMHSGLLALRDELPQNIRARVPLERTALSAECQHQIARVEQIWSATFEQYAGPWLFGEFSIADVMFAPVALRFVTYQIELCPPAQRFVSMIQGLDSIKRWAKEAAAEPEALDFIDHRIPSEQTPLVLG